MKPSGSGCRVCRAAARHASRRYQSTAHPSKAPEIYDVVTVGGGPVGLAILAALKSSPVTSHLKCGLIETQDLSKSRHWSIPSDQYSNRASSLTPANVSFLDRIGAMQHVDQSRIQPYDEMQVWDATNESSMQFDWRAEATKYNSPPRTVATMVENLNLTRGLLKRINQLDADESLLSSTSVSQIENGQDEPDGFNFSTWPILSLNSSSSASSFAPTRLAARLLIGADGFNSPVRTFAGIASHGWDYDRHGVVATLRLQPEDPATFTDPQSWSFDSASSADDLTKSNRATAYQRFLPALGGPIAILPLPDNHASLVWSTTPENAAYLKTLDQNSFVATVNAALRLDQTDIKYMFTLPGSSTTAHESELSWRLQHTVATDLSRQIPTVDSVQPNTVASFPLRLRHAKTLTSPRVALAGDAAHTIHPLAGQGLNLGLADAAAISSTIAYAVEHGMDIGATMTLDRYASQRFGKGLMMAWGTDSLNWIYQLGGGDSRSRSGDSIDDGLGSALLAKLRGVGMDVVGAVPGLKEFIMRRAG